MRKPTFSSGAFCAVIIVLLATVNVSARTLYWVGGSGDWSDAAHWSLTNGGAGGNSLPTSTDDVFFTANSFSSPGDILNMDITHPECSTMQWNGVIPAGVTISNSNRQGDALSIYGSIKLKGSSNWQYAGTVALRSSASGNTIDLNGIDLRAVVFNGGGSWNFLSPVKCSSVDLRAGHVYTMNRALRCRSFYSSGGTSRGLHAGTSGIFSRDWWIDGSNFTMDGDSATFHLQTVQSYAPATYHKMITDFDPIDNGGYHWLRLEGSDMTIDSLIAREVTNIGGPDITIHNALFKGDVSMAGPPVHFGKIELRRAFLTSTSMFCDTFYVATGGYSVQIQSGATLFADYFITAATCGANTTIRSHNPDEYQADISVASGTVNCSYLNLHGINATGGATFNATNSVDMGNVTGWNILSTPAPRTLYWVNGGGNWRGTAHWSLTSGGSPGECQPNFQDDVVFDTNSFSSPGDTVYINTSAALCHNMTWATDDSPVVTGEPLGVWRHRFFIYGNLTFSSDVTWEYPSQVVFSGSTQLKTITMNGGALGEVVFDGPGSSWLLQDAFTCGMMEFLDGTLKTQGSALNAGYCSLLGDSVDLANSVVTSEHFINNLPPSQFDGTSATIACAYFDGFGQTYHNIHMANIHGSIFYGQNCIVDELICNDNMYFDNHSIDNVFGTAHFLGSAEVSGDASFGTAEFNGTATLLGNNTFDTLRLFNAGFNTVFDAAGIQTTGYSLETNAGVSDFVSLASNNPGTAAQLNCYQDTVCLDYLLVRDITIAGPDVFYAGANSTDLGNNTNMYFVSCATPVITVRTLYWVDGSGDWDDTAHWSLTSGGTPGEPAPTYLDDVVFDDNSFTGASDIIDLNHAPAECHDMTWNFNGFTPVVYDDAGDPSPRELSVFGSLTLDTGIMWSYPFPLVFTGSETDNTITTANVSINDILFDSPSAIWFLQDSVTCDNLDVSDGSLFTNDNSIYCSADCHIGGNAVLDLGTSFLRAYDFSNAALAANFDADSAVIRCQNFGGANQLYGTLELSIAGTAHFIASGCTIENMQGIGPVDFYSSGSNTIEHADFHMGGTITGTQTFVTANFLAGGVRTESSNYFDTLTFTPDGTGYIEMAAGQSQFVYESLIVNVDPGYYFHFVSTSTTDANLTCYQEEVCLDYVRMTLINANGPADFHAGSHSIDHGGNTNISFTDCSSSARDMGQTVQNGNQDASRALAEGNAVAPLQLYPNPTNGNVTMTYSVPAGGESVTIEIFDVAGRCVYNEQKLAAAEGMYYEEIFSHGWQAGIYSCKVTVGANVQTIRLVKTD